jgi:sodium transport system permease protein
LFVNPVSRSRILIGKLAATSAFALTSVLLGIIAFSLVGRVLPTEKLGMTLEIGPRFAFMTMLAMLPLVFLIATLQTLAAAFAKSFREAQTYLSLLMFVPAVPTMLLSLFPVKTETWMYAVPLMGQQITITRLMRGDAVSAEQLGLCFVCTAAAALLVYAVTAVIYRGERLAIST